MFKNFKVKSFIYEVSIEKKTKIYSIDFAEKELSMLSCILSGTLFQIHVLWKDTHELKKANKRYEYLDDNYGIIIDILDEEDKKLPLLARKYLGYGLGEMGTFCVREYACTAHYRFRDESIFCVPWDTDSDTPFYTNTFDNFIEIVDWWVDYIEKKEKVKVENWDNFSL